MYYRHYRGGGTGFLLGYVVLGFFNALIDVAKGVFELFALVLNGLFKLAGLGFDATRNSSFDSIVEAALTPYIPVLVAKRQKLLRADEYGVVQTDPWAKELNYFMSHVFLSNLGTYSGYASRHLAYTMQLIDNVVSQHQPVPVD